MIEEQMKELRRMAIHVNAERDHMKEDLAALRAESVFFRPGERGSIHARAEERVSRPKAVTEFKGITLGMSAREYRAAKSQIWMSFDLNLNRCGWEETDCLIHVARYLPSSFKVAVGKMTTLAELASFLDKNFLPETDDHENDEWDAMEIGSKSIAEHLTTMEDLAGRLGKGTDELRRAFIKSFRADYPELWRKMRTDMKSYNLNRLVSASKEWMELTRGDQKAPSSTRPTRAAAVVPDERDGVVASVSEPAPMEANGKLTEMKNQLDNQIGDLSSLVKSLTTTLGTMLPAMHAGRGAVVESAIRNRPGPYGPPQDQRGLPTDWIRATVERTGPREGYAKLTITPEDHRVGSQPIYAHVLTTSAPAEVRNALKVNDQLEVKIARDAVGIRVVELKSLRSN